MTRLTLALSALPILALSVGCVGIKGGRSTVFDRQEPPRRGYGSYQQNAYYEPEYSDGWEPAPPPRNSGARESSRVSGLEAQVARLQAQMDSMTAAQESVLEQANASVTRSSASQNSIRAELDALRLEVNSLKAENQTLRNELASQRQQLTAMPDKITRAVTAALPKQTSSSGRSSSSGGSRAPAHECYEHTVAAGDTVSAIAAAYHVTTSDIVRENNLKDSASIRVGQVLYIPKK